MAKAIFSRGPEHPDDMLYWYHESHRKNREGIESQGIKPNLTEIPGYHDDFPEGQCPYCAEGNTRMDEEGRHEQQAWTTFYHHNSAEATQGIYSGEQGDLYAVPKTAIKVNTWMAHDGVFGQGAQPHVIKRVGHFTDSVHRSKHDMWVPQEECPQCKDLE